MQQNKTKLGICTLILFSLFAIQAFAQQPNEYVDLSGELEVIHVDDFEHPENSRYFFYLVANGQRYELISDTQLPVVISGTQANVKGRLFEGKIIVEDFAVKQPTTALSEEEQAIITEETDEAVAGQKFNLVWLYAGAPIILVLALLVYIDLKRKKDHQALIQQKEQHNIFALRNYITTNLRKGYSKEQIRNALIKNNYSNEEIEEAFRGIK